MELIEGAIYASDFRPGAISIVHVSFTPDARRLRRQFSEQLVLKLSRAFPDATFELAFGDETEFAIKAQPEITLAVVIGILGTVATELGIALHYREYIHTDRMLRTLLHWLGLPYATDILREFDKLRANDPTA